MLEFTIGSDIEVLLKDNKGIHRSAIGLIGGSKESPRKTTNGYVQEDNVTAEFNVNPANTREDFINNTLLILSDLSDIVHSLDLSIDITPGAFFDPSELNHSKALLAGCTEDYNAWSLTENPKPCLYDTTFRSCGGHVHISFPQANHADPVMQRVNMVRVMDLVAGVPSVLLDSNTERRKLYGKAGAFRFKFVGNKDPYDGVEYRTLSNFWLKTPELIGWVYEAVDSAVNNFESLLEIANENEEDIVSAINNSDQELAKSIVKKYKLVI